MKQYKCLTSQYDGFEMNGIYDENSKGTVNCLTVKQLIKKGSHNWQEQEIIGYKLKSKFRNNMKVRKAACVIEGYQHIGEDSILDKLIFPSNADICCAQSVFISIKKLKDAKVFYLWFEPIYGSNYSLPEISGYEGEIIIRNDGQLVKYGCKTVKISTLKELLELGVESISLDEGFINRVEMAKIITYANNL